MIEIQGKIDINDLIGVEKLTGKKAVMSKPCPFKNGNIHPNTTKFLLEDGRFAYVFHVKPIYYETLDEKWRPMSEIADGFGNKWLNLKENWDKKMHPRFLSWLLRRYELAKGNINFPFPAGLNPIREGKEIFFTTTTAYPDPNPETNTVDGYVRRFVAAQTWAQIRDGAGTTGSLSDQTEQCAQIYAADASDWDLIARSIYLFLTSAIPDTETIDSATLSIYGIAPSGNIYNGNIDIVSSNPASNTDLVAADYGTLGTTVYGAVAMTWTESAYNDFTLNASGIATISKTGVTKFGLRFSNDTTDSEPSPRTGNHYITCRFADYTGTDSDPKLVVVSSAAAGPANMKTWDGLAKASVKTVNGLAIGSVKTWDSLA